ncbi:MAG: hypothetical protein D6798_04390 [Deltaproteobacteria bacterium]|nr:MAG: hypothetical protein D6798_04390 [Deltaproteobacteria bacterium]
MELRARSLPVQLQPRRRRAPGQRRHRGGFLRQRRDGAGVAGRRGGLADGGTPGRRLRLHELPGAGRQLLIRAGRRLQHCCEGLGRPGTATVARGRIRVLHPRHRCPVVLSAPLLLSLLGACAPTADDFTVTADLAAEVGTVVEVRWSSTRNVDAAVLRVHDDLGETWEQDITNGQATVWGLPPDSEVDLHVVFDLGNQEIMSDTVSVTTDPAPNWLPELLIDGDVDRALGGSLMMMSLIGSHNGAAMVDGAGRYRWWVELPGISAPSRARPSVDGRQVLVLPVNVDGSDDSGLQRINLDGSLGEPVVVEGQHHDFVELADGTLAFIVHSPRREGGVEVLGDKIVEVAPDGTQTTIWDAWDWIDYNGEQPAIKGEGWIHGNALDYDEETGQYTLSMLGIRAMARIDRATGEMLWLMGTADSDFRLPNGSTTIIDRGHQFEFLDGSLLAFENGDSDRASSRAVEYSFDESQPRMELLWSYEPVPSLYTFSMGDVHRLVGGAADGDTVVDFCANGVIHQVDADGAVVWSMLSDLGAAFGYMSFPGPPGSF